MPPGIFWVLHTKLFLTKELIAQLKWNGGLTRMEITSLTVYAIILKHFFDTTVYLPFKIVVIAPTGSLG